MSTQILLEQNDYTHIENQDRKLLLSRFPVQEKTLELSGITTSVLEGGAGAPIILLHGQGEFALTWMRVFSDLVTSHKIIVPDLPGHGASAMPADSLNAERVMDWLNDLIEQTCDTPPVLVGHLLGGAIALRYAAKYRSKISKLVLVDSMGLSWYKPTLKFAVAMIGFIAKPNERSQEKLFQGCFTDLAGLQEDVADIWDPLAAYSLDRARSPELKSALQNLMPKLGVPAISAKDLEQINVPTTMIWGRHDLQVRLAVAEKAHKRFGWPLHIIDRAADDPAFEQPQAFLSAFRSAL